MRTQQSGIAPERWSRRGWLAAAGSAAAAALTAGGRADEPRAAAPEPRLRLGLAAYGFRRYFHWNRGAEQPPADADPARRLSPETFVDLAADLGCDGAEITSYYFPPQADDDDLRALRRQAFLRGVAISGVAVGNKFTKPPGPGLDAEIADVKRWIERTATLGATHLRVFAGEVPKGGSPEEARRTCIGALSTCAEHAARHGVVLGLENHGGIVATADGLLDIVEAVDSPWLGVNLDTGNFIVEDPYAELARCVSRAVNVQYKSEMQRRPGGPKEPADAARVVAMLRDGGYRGFVTLEYEADENPFTAVPRHLRELRGLLG